VENNVDGGATPLGRSDEDSPLEAHTQDKTQRNSRELNLIEIKQSFFTKKSSVSTRGENHLFIVIGVV